MNNFEKAFKENKTCADCGHAITFDNLGTVVCGVWHTTLSKSSLCEEFKTPEAVRAKIVRDQKAWQSAKKDQQP